MKEEILKRLKVLAALMGLLVVTACAQDEVMRTTEVIERQGDESVLADITMGAGNVTINGGAAALLEAEFVYNVSDWRPKVEYEVDENQGRLIVQQPVTADIKLGNVRYEWALHFNDDVPLDLRVKLGAGENDLDLSGLTLTNLDAVIGTGNVTLDLTGDWQRGFEARIRGGVGQATLRLPRDVGVRVRVQAGLGQLTALGLKRADGAYVNGAYGASDVTLDIQVQGGVGSIDLELAE
jgi:hypothetical protein